VGCEAPGVSQSAFSDWRAGHTHQPGEKERTDAELLAAIRRLHADSGEADEVWRISAALWPRRLAGQPHARARGSWPTTAWPATAPAKRRSTTKRDSSEPPVPDLVGRRLRPAVLDHVWCGDLSAIPTGQGWLYLATVIDPASRRLLGWLMSDAPDAQLMIDALEHAVAARGVTHTDGVIFHSDRGTQYLSHAFAQ
jgi:transposase InsO family protein